MALLADWASSKGMGVSPNFNFPFPFLFPGSSALDEAIEGSEVAISTKVGPTLRGVASVEGPSKLLVEDQDMDLYSEDDNLGP